MVRNPPLLSISREDEMQSADICAALYAAISALDGDRRVTVDMIEHAKDRCHSGGSTGEIMDVAGMFTTFAETLLTAARTKS
jgi:hypothetical protein